MLSLWQEFREDILVREEVFEDKVLRAKNLQPSSRTIWRYLLHDAGVRGLLLYRLAKWSAAHSIPMLPSIFSQLNVILNGLSIDHRATIGYALALPHPIGVVIGNVIIEDCVWIFSSVVLGGRGSRTMVEDGGPYIEQGVSIGTGAKVLGPVRVGARSRIGANSVVLTDVPPDSVVVGVPGRILVQTPKNETME